MFQQENKSINPRKNAAFKSYRNDSGNSNLKSRLKYIQASLDISTEVAK